MAKRVATWVGLVAALAMASAGTPCRAQAAGAVVETRHLLASDATGRLPDGQLQALAEQAQATLDRLLELWGCPAQTETFGKILLIYDEPLRGHCTSTCFVRGQRGGRASGEPTRTVRVFGCAEAPLMLAHKFTAALMPQPDKLLRNMMGAISEMRLGNPMSFPACGQDVDDWVRSFARGGTLIPLGQLGPDHESWGMRDLGGGRLMALDRVRQLRAYAETASFARYLEAAHGLDSLKRLTRLSRTQARPWQEALGADLAELEARWLESLKAGGAGREEQAGRMARVMGRGFGDPCALAQRGVGLR
ncbi:MAG: hypothetical protein RDU24_09880 [Humidesulfovibrio sp.]|uniref:hypothetical protein n=1 Tax=Humidesulfovibrio sp. TaxID=2910988 RepID=UPI0027EBE210|nr:hypothetical protein [Humidesulfovibrio sp.]MDQ7835678.1 hypothetical protein [Humidesulfovibrio sp.]